MRLQDRGGGRVGPLKENEASIILYFDYEGENPCSTIFKGTYEIDDNDKQKLYIDIPDEFNLNILKYFVEMYYQIKKEHENNPMSSIKVPKMPLGWTKS